MSEGRRHFKSPEVAEIEIVKRYSGYIGVRFGNMVVRGVIRREEKDGRKRAFFEMECDCGNFCYRRVTDVRNGKVTNCGCGGDDWSIEDSLNPRSKGRPSAKKKVYGEQVDVWDTDVSVIVARLKPQLYCESPDPACIRGSIEHICCSECDKQERCKMRCLSSPLKCRAALARKGRLMR